MLRLNELQDKKLTSNVMSRPFEASYVTNVSTCKVELFLKQPRNFGQTPFLILPTTRLASSGIVAIEPRRNHSEFESLNVYCVESQELKVLSSAGPKCSKIHRFQVSTLY